MAVLLRFGVIWKRIALASAQVPHGGVTRFWRRWWEYAARPNFVPGELVPVKCGDIHYPGILVVNKL